MVLIPIILVSPIQSSLPTSESGKLRAMKGLNLVDANRSEVMMTSIPLRLGLDAEMHGRILVTGYLVA